MIHAPGNSVGMTKTPQPAGQIPHPLSSADDDPLMTQAEVAQLLGIRAQTLAVWRHRRVGPPFVQLSPRQPRYRRAAVIAWLASRDVEVQP